MLGWKPLLVSWLSTLPKTLNEENLELIKDLFDRMEEALLQFVRKGGFKVIYIRLEISTFPDEAKLFQYNVKKENGIVPELYICTEASDV